MSLNFNFRNWFKKEDPAFKYGAPVYISSLAELPEELGTSIFVIGNKKKNKWVVFKCPDNCGRRVEVNLMKTKTPNWSAKIKRKKISLSPSIIVKDCNAHFWLVESKIFWARFDDDFTSDV
jgi:hypothetical protein